MTGAWRPVAVLLLVLVATAAGADPSAEIARVYVDAASEALRDDDHERASQLLAVAREFGPEASDVLYLTATIHATEQARTRSAIELAEAATEADSWARFSLLHGEVLLARLLNRIGAFERAGDVLEEPAIVPGSPDELVADYYHERLRALVANGRMVDDTLRRARDRYPNDPRFFWFALRREPQPSFEYRLETERLLGHASSGDQAWMDEVLYEYALRAPTPGERDWAVGALVEREWGDPRIARVLVIDDPSGAVDAFVERDGFRDLGTYLALLQSLGPDQHAQLSDRAATFTGTSLLDVDGDGWWNERVDVDGGLIIRWARDMNQDGLLELEVGFNASAPEETTLRDAEQTMRLRYGQYPFLSEGEIQTELGREVFAVAPRSLRLDVVRPLSVRGPLFDGGTRLAASVRSFARRELIAGSIRIDHVRPDGTVAERTLRQAGVRSTVLRDENGDGVWDHLLLTDGGFATSGIRDLDGDGYYEIAEAYRNGSLAAVAIDADDNGLPEVYEQYGRFGSRDWDLNEDGRIDVREFRFWTDSVLREFPLEEQTR